MKVKLKKNIDEIANKLINNKNEKCEICNSFINIEKHHPDYSKPTVNRKEKFKELSRTWMKKEDLTDEDWYILQLANLSDGALRELFFEHAKKNYGKKDSHIFHEKLGRALMIKLLNKNKTIRAELIDLVDKKEELKKMGGKLNESPL